MPVGTFMGSPTPAPREKARNPLLRRSREREGRFALGGVSLLKFRLAILTAGATPSVVVGPGPGAKVGSTRTRGSAATQPQFLP